MINISVCLINYVNDVYFLNILMCTMYWQNKVVQIILKYISKKYILHKININVESYYSICILYITKNIKGYQHKSEIIYGLRTKK